jgi:proteasome accessory factor C
VSRPLAGPRLARVLAIVPYVCANPDTTVAELAERFRVPRAEIERDLALLPMCGLPPYTADRLIDVWVDDEGYVEIRLAEYFERPLRLTPAEGVALVAAARALLAVPGADPEGPLGTAVAKLEAIVGVSGRVAVDVGHAPLVGTLRDAVAAGERLELDYHSFARDELTTRRVDPTRVFHVLGAWYLDAHCHRAGAERRFRVDRILAVRPTGETVPSRTAPPPSGPAPLTDLVFTPRPDDRRVTLRLAPAVAWVADDLPLDDRADEADGSVRVTLAVSGDAFLERLLLRLGPAVEILGPPEAVALRAAAAARVLARYSR